MKTMNCKMALVRVVLSGLVLVASAHGANIVSNAGFETGDFTSWTRINATGFSGVSGSICPSGADTTCVPHTGNFAAFFGDPSLPLEGITQTLTTLSGTTYNLDFWLLVDTRIAGPAGTEYKVSFGSTVLADVFDAHIAPYQHLSFSATAAGPTTDLKFEFKNAPSWFGLDDVTVVIAPAPSGAPEPVSSGLVGASLIALVGLRRFLRRP